MRSLLVLPLSLLVATAHASPSHHAPRAASSAAPLATDISQISGYWGQISPYADNADDYFGVQWTGLPDGCQVEQAHLLQRHAQRYPTSGDDDGENDERFAAKVANFTAAHPGAGFTGPLEFLNGYSYVMSENYLTGIGAATEFAAGVYFWNRYGRTLYNASVAQPAYNASFLNGTARAKPVLRTTSQSRIWNSQISWALGFFGPSFQFTPVPTLGNWTDAFNVVVIPEGGTENNTLASYDSCFNDDNLVTGYLGDISLFTYIPKYLTNATARLQAYAPAGLTLTTNDTYAMQSICAYETNYIGASSFCGLFTLDEWAGFENTLDIEYYYDYAWGNPTGRAQGLGYLQELLARLQNEYIPASNSSVNSTLDDNAASFPLGAPFYADFSHDDIIISVLTAMSLDYLREPPSLTAYPPDPARHFLLSRLVPFGSRLVTEVIGCAAPSPAPVQAPRVPYSPGQYGYTAGNASNKFIRMRLNSGILPLDTIRGGGCAGRIDGLCALEAFIQSQAGAEAEAMYAQSCFGNYTVEDPTSGQDYDGNAALLL